MLCECSAIGKFWAVVLNIIQRVYEVLISPQPQLCVLGLLSDLVCPAPRLLGVSQMLFQARKLSTTLYSAISPIGEFLNLVPFSCTPLSSLRTWLTLLE